MKLLKFTGLFVSAGLLMLSVACKQESKEENTENTEVVADSTSNDMAETAGYKIGDMATEFSLKNVDGNMVGLSDMKDAKGYIVVFTCNHCPYAQAWEDRIIALDKKYKEQGYPVIAINPNDPEKVAEDSFDNMVARVKEKGYTFPYLLDEGQKVYPQYGATKTPHVYVLQKTENGNIVKYMGAIDDNYEDASAVKKKYVENAVDELLAGKEVSEKETKAIGCSVKA